MLRTSESMSNISPKLIDVEGNRVEYEEGTFEKYSKTITNKNEVQSHLEGLVSLDNDGAKTGLNYMIVINEGGRFPTQLFTNNKKEQYKYVKNI